MRRVHLLLCYQFDYAWFRFGQRNPHFANRIQPVSNRMFSSNKIFFFRSVVLIVFEGALGSPDNCLADPSLRTTALFSGLNCLFFILKVGGIAPLGTVKTKGL